MRCCLKNIADIQSGVFLKTVPEGEVFYLQISDFDGEGVYRKVGKPVVPFRFRLQEHLLVEGDLLFAAKGVSNFSAVYRNEWGRAVASSSFLVVRIKDKQSVLPEFLCWFLNLPYVIGRLKSMAVGSSILSVSKKMLEDVGIELPGLARQRRIIELAELQRQERHLYQVIALKRKKISDRLLIQFMKEDGK